jgi:dolichol-phosphate mannosyltransferase
MVSLQQWASAPGSAERDWRGLVLGVVGYSFLLRVIYSGQIELLPEETYYWNYSRHLDIGYLDHPPMVAWLIRLGTSLFGNTEFGVRVGALSCGVVTALCVFRLTRNLFGERSALLALLMVQVLPFFFLSGMLMTPDAPLTAAWAASLYYFERALIAERRSAWICAGLTLGLGMLSKYTIGLLSLAIAVFMLVDPAARRWFRRWQPYTAGLLAAAVFAPVIVWNAEHDWVSFAFQTSRRLAERPRFALHKLIGAAVVLLTPTGVLAVADTVFRGRPSSAAKPGDAAVTRAWRMLQLAVLVPLSVFVLFSLRHEVKLDWSGAPWLAALPLIAGALADAPGSRSGFGRRLRAAWPPTIAVLLLFYGAGFYYLVKGIPGLGYSQQTELVPVGWRDLGGQIERIAAAIRGQQPHGLLIVGMDRYAIASELAFYSSDQSRAVANTSSGHLFDGMGLMYEQWFPTRQQSGRTLLLVSFDAASLDATQLMPHVERLDPLQVGTLLRGGHIVRRYYYRVAYGYRPSDAK